MDEDLYIFLKDFGIQLSFTLPDETVIDKNANGESLLGIFDKTYADPNLGYMRTKIDKPTLTCVEADVKRVVKNSTVLIKDVIYKVLDTDEDGTGFTTIKLTKN
nr:MAG TPA: ATP-binding sugar transporter [Bacteriophage sp.]